jgi:hypothetical protein
VNSGCDELNSALWYLIFVIGKPIPVTSNLSESEL